MVTVCCIFRKESSPTPRPLFSAEAGEWDISISQETFALPTHTKKASLASPECGTGRGRMLGDKSSLTGQIVDAALSTEACHHVLICGKEFALPPLICRLFADIQDLDLQTRQGANTPTIPADPRIVEN